MPPLTVRFPSVTIAMPMMAPAIPVATECVGELPLELVILGLELAERRSEFRERPLRRPIDVVGHREGRERQRGEQR
jgi:hypothetical protein